MNMWLKERMTKPLLSKEELSGCRGEEFLSKTFHEVAIELSEGCNSDELLESFI